MDRALIIIQINIAGNGFCGNELAQCDGKVSQLAQLQFIKQFFETGGICLLAYGGIKTDSAADCKNL